MQDGNPKQLITDRIKNATNILVTVSRDPSVDELSAALGLTLMLNKLDKHATAVFSGQIPPAITFLEPNKTFENTVDSLRDFIIALDKEKADRLRYKVEDDVVRIFITPYRTTITDKDLQFSQGDFNVELIVALGVEKREDLDNAITAHGRILHDATVVTINAGATASSLGAIDWSDGNASSLCEMLMSLSEALQTGILDEQIASALLTGLVSATDRFSNAHTSPRVMTMAAQLMAAGANQQLIATKLEEGHALPAVSEPAPKDGTKKLEEGSSEKVNKQAKKTSEPESDQAPEPAPKPDGEMDIKHDKSGQTAKSEGSLPEPTTVELPAVDDDNKSDDLKEAETELQASLKKSATPTLSVADLKKDLDEASKDLDEAAATPPTSAPDQISNEKGDWRNKPIEPTFGGTLNATANEAEEDKRREDESNRNHTILNHDQPVGGNVSTQNAHAVLNSSSMPDFEETPLNTAPFEDSSKTIHTAPLQPTHGQTLAELEDEAKHPTAPIAEAANSLDDARAAVDAALGSIPFDAAHQPLDSLGAQSFGNDLHPDSEQAPSFAPTNIPETPASMPPLATESVPAAPVTLPPLPPMPDFSTLPPLPPLPGEPMAAPAQFAPQPPVAAPSPVPPMPSVLPLEDTTPLPPQVPAAPDPGQFKIPGQ